MAKYYADASPTLPADHHAPGNLPHYSVAPAPRQQIPVAGYDPRMMDAPNQMIRVAHEPTDPRCGCTPGNCSCGPACGCMCCYGNGPGGNTTLIQYNEKGILEDGLHHLISMGTADHELYHEHDSYMQGIYKESPADESFEMKAGW